MGLQTPLSHVPSTMLPYNDQMTFIQRFYNVIVSTYQWIVRKVVLSLHDQMAQQYFTGILNNKFYRAIVFDIHFKDYSPLPSVEELERSIALILINSHPSIFPVRPKMPGMVDILGAGLSEPKPLPNDIQVKEYMHRFRG